MIGSALRPGHAQQEKPWLLAATVRRCRRLKATGSMLRGFGLVVFTAASLHAVEQRLEVQPGTSSRLAISLDSPPVFFWERLTYAFNDRSEEVFADRLHAFNMLRWSMQSTEVDLSDFRDRTSRAAQNGLSTTLSYSIRDTIADSPLMLWLEERQGFLGSFLRDSIDGVEEESVSPLDGSYGLVEHSWWKNLRDSRAIRYGIRPFRTSPYLFTSFAVQDHNELLFMSHVRYYYDKLADHRFEIAVSVPLTYGFTLSAGTSYQFGQHSNEGRTGVKLFKELSTGGIVHLGFELRERPTLLAGITLLW
jgi:hypothetical protein